jgi:hypothetical protein
VSPSAGSRQRRHQRQVERCRELRRAQARETQALQAEAAVRQDFSRRRRRHAIALMMILLAGVIGVYHFFEHLDVVPAMTGSSGADDIFVGWPTALALAVGAAIVYGK